MPDAWGWISDARFRIDELGQSLRRLKKFFIETEDKFFQFTNGCLNKGYATDLAEEIINLHCVACPILNHKLKPIASIWISGPSDRLQSERFYEFGDIIGEFALRISRRLGYEPEVSGYAVYD